MPFDLRKLLSPKSVAIVGASPREGVAATRVINNLRRLAYSGDIYPVNPRYPEVQGLRCYPSLSALPTTPEAVFVAIAAEDAVPVIEDAGRAGIGAAIVNASGFADSGGEGEALQRRLAAAAGKSNMAVCGPNNMGFMNIHDRICMWTARVIPALRPGPAAIISQSGSIAIALSEDVRNIGLSYVITAGNEAVCTAADYLQAVVRDDRVGVVMMFLETIRNPRLFAAASLEAAERGKRILVLKVGRSEGGMAAVAAHTGALSGEDEVYDAFFRRLGIVRVDDLDEMIETAMLFSRYADPPELRSSILVTVSGGEAALIADIAANVGVKIADLAPSTLEAMTPAFPSFSRPRNPVDAWGLGWNVDRFRQIYDALLREPSAGFIGLAVDAPGSGGADEHVALDMARVCIEAKATHNKKVVAFNNTVAGDVNRKVRDVLDAHGIPYLLGMRAALAAMAHWSRLELPAPQPVPASRSLPELAALDEAGRFQLLANAGVPMVACLRARTGREAQQIAAELGFPVVLKGTAASLPHKTELGLVKLGLIDAASVVAAHAALTAALARHAPDDPQASVVVQPMVGDGVQLLVGARNDPQFGAIIVVGLGGTLVEVMGEASLRIGPVDRETAREMLAETKAGKLLSGIRGKGPCDLDAAIDAIVAVSRFACESTGSLAAVEVNPLVVREKGRGAAGVDLVLEPLAPQTNA
jgi:acyl-CoA synthetase (NDP forming)